MSLIKHKQLYNNQINITFLNGSVIPLMYEKKGAISPTLLYSLNRNYWNMKSETATLFTKNLKDRGSDNRDKRLYMNAVTSDKFVYYDKWINSMVEYIKEDIYLSKCIISSIKKHTTHFFLNIHYSIDSYLPKYRFLFDYFTEIINLSSNHESQADILSVLYSSVNLRNKYSKMYKFTERRVNHIIKNNLNDNIPYYWYNNGNGFSIKQVVSGVLHNIIAFTQFTMVSDSLFKPEIFNGYKDIYYGNPFYVIREIFRKHPTSGKIFSQKGGKQVCHHLQQIMKNSDNNYNKDKPIDFYKEYTLNKTNKLVVSNIDNETIIEKENSGNIPIYIKPVYCPFGLGYRRCAGENISYYICYKLFNLYFKYDLKVDNDDKSKIKIGIFRIVDDNRYLY